MPLTEAQQARLTNALTPQNDEESQTLYDLVTRFETLPEEDPLKRLLRRKTSLNAATIHPNEQQPLPQEVMEFTIKQVHQNTTDQQRQNPDFQTGLQNMLDYANKGFKGRELPRGPLALAKDTERRFAGERGDRAPIRIGCGLLSLPFFYTHTFWSPDILGTTDRNQSDQFAMIVGASATAGVMTTCFGSMLYDLSSDVAKFASPPPEERKLPSLNRILAQQTTALEHVAIADAEQVVVQNPAFVQPGQQAQAVLDGRNNGGNGVLHI